MKKSLFVLSVLIVSLVAAGCGSKDEDTTTNSNLPKAGDTTKPPAKDNAGTATAPSAQ